MPVADSIGARAVARPDLASVGYTPHGTMAHSFKLLTQQKQNTTLAHH